MIDLAYKRVNTDDENIERIQDAIESLVVQLQSKLDAFDRLVPIGTRLTWSQPVEGDVLPELPASFVPLDGSVVRDPESPLEGFELPVTADTIIRIK